jgi:hypothetical protein
MRGSGGLMPWSSGNSTNSGVLVHCIVGIQELIEPKEFDSCDLAGPRYRRVQPGHQAAIAYPRGRRTIRTGIDPRTGECRNEVCPETPGTQSGVRAGFSIAMK